MEFKPEEVHRTEHLTFKKRKDLLAFHERHPGALAAQFLLQVRRKLSRPMPENSHQLIRTDTSVWSTTPSMNELKELRHQKEVQFLGKLMMDLAEERLPQVLDAVVMRVREIRTAKAAGGSWDKAATISLMPSTAPVSTVLPDGALALRVGSCRPPLRCGNPWWRGRYGPLSSITSGRARGSWAACGGHGLERRGGRG